MASLPQENPIATEEKSSEPPAAVALSEAKEGLDSELQVNPPFPSPPRSPPSPTSPPSPVSPASPASPTSDTLAGADCPAGPTEAPPEERQQMDTQENKKSEEEEEEEVVAATSSAVMLTDVCPKTTSNYAYAR